MTSPGYLRFPHITNDIVVFVAADDVWLAPLAGGRAWRFTTDEAQAATPRLTPDGTQVAWVSAKDGSPEIYVASLADGTSTRLTYWGTSWARVSGWTPAGEVLAVSAANQPFGHYVRARVLTTALSGRPGAERVLPFGLVSDLSLGTSGNSAAGDSAAAAGRGAGTVGLLTGTWGRFNSDPANWKRYRGGTAGRLWVGPATAVVSGAQGAADRIPGPFRRVLADLPGQFASPMIVGARFAFIGDHEGTGNIYSCALDGSDLRRHTDHEGWYARQASTDGQRIVYACGGELWLLEGLQAAGPVRLDITLGSPVRGRAPRLVTAEDHVGSLSVDHGGRASSIEVRGTVHWLTHRDGPARAVSVVPGVRARFPQVLGTDGQVVWATDAGGSDALEIGSGDPARPADPAAVPRRIAAGQVGRITGLRAAPDGRTVAVAAQDGRLRVVDIGSGQVREISASDNGVVTGLAWSPDSAWLAWSHPAEQPITMAHNPLRRLRLARIADGQVFDVTDGRFADTEPVFTLDGKYLAFLSMRDFDPVYDAHVFDLMFPYGARPYLLPLDGTTPSPFAPELGGRPIGEPADKLAEPADKLAEPADKLAAADDGPRVPPVPVETTRMADRIVALPVPEARYSGLRAVKDGLAWLREPVTGNLGIGGAQPADDAPRPTLERFNFAAREVRELAGPVDWFEASGDGTRLVTSDHDKLTLIAAESKADGGNPDDEIEIDRSRARFLFDPPAAWRQAYAEAGRIMRHDFWVPDMADVDWDAVQDEYRPLLDRITTTSEFVDLLWEIFGELSTSHAYAYLPGRGTPAAGPGQLGADIERSGDAWRLTRVLHGDTSDPRARAPLAAPGAGIAAGDVLLAVDGRPVGPDGPGPLLTGAAGKPVELTVAPADGSRPRSVPVVPLRSDTRLRYLDWVRAKREQVGELGGGRIGYLHVPDMVSQGWADFHRDLRTEMLRDALIVDVRGNTGGDISELVVEKLARRVVAWDVPGGLMPATYPEDAPRGPVVAIADECSGSDGDIVTGAVRLLRLGPVVGARTWGGVIGYDNEHELIDGTQMTVPRLAFWFEEYGWGVENHGVDPDVEVIMSPDDWAAERDTQLETAIRLALEALQQRPAVRPPDVRTRPSKRRPPLPPRGA